MAIKTYGLMGVDWEERVDYERDESPREDRAVIRHHVGIDLHHPVGRPVAAI